MKAVILAGGLGQRLRPFTEVIPKPLLPVGDQSILDVQIHALSAAGVDEVFVATNYRSDLVQAYLGDGSRFGLKVTISREEKPLGTAGPLTLLRERLTEPFLMMNGDILTKLDFAALYRFGCEHSADLTVGTKVITTPFRFGNVEVGEDGCIASVDEKPEFQLEIGQEEQKSVLKGTRWLLVKIPENSREDKDEASRLREALTLSARLAAAYYLTEDLRQVWDEATKDGARRFLEGWIERARATGIRQLRQMAKTLSLHKEEILAHKEWILAYYDESISTGPLESTNTKIKLLQRRAYGYRDQEFFRGSSRSHREGQAPRVLASESEH